MYGKVAEKKPLVTRDVLDLCDERRDFRKSGNDERVKEYRKANKRVQKALKKTDGA